MSNDEMPALDVVDIGIWDRQPCAFDGHGGCIVFDAIARDPQGKWRSVDPIG